MKKINIKNKFLLIFLGTAVHFYWLDGLGGALLEFTIGSTTYVPGYREYKFRSIRKGMSEAEVIKILGEPLGKNSNYPNVWFYAYGKNILEKKYPEESTYTQRIIKFKSTIE